MKYRLKKAFILAICASFMLVAGLAQLPRELQVLIISFIEQMPDNLEANIKRIRQQLSVNQELRQFVESPLVTNTIVEGYVQRFGTQAAVQELAKAIDRADVPVIRALLSTGKIAINEYSIIRNGTKYTPLGYARLISPVDTVKLSLDVMPVLEEFRADPNRVVLES